MEVWLSAPPAPLGTTYEPGGVARYAIDDISKWVKFNPIFRRGKEKRNKVSEGEFLESTEPTHFHIVRRMLTISGK